MSLDTVLIHTIPARKHTKFVDPYPYDPNAENNVDEAGNVSAPASNPTTIEAKPEEEVSGPVHNFLLGESHLKDTNGGDGGCIYKKPEVVP